MCAREAKISANYLNNSVGGDTSSPLGAKLAAVALNQVFGVQRWALAVVTALDGIADHEGRSSRSVVGAVSVGF